MSDLPKKNTVDFSIRNITERAEKSPLWKDLSEQQSMVLPYLLERYLLLENWRFLESEEEVDRYSVSFLHLLIADMATCLLDYEQRLRGLEEEGLTK